MTETNESRPVEPMTEPHESRPVDPKRRWIVFAIKGALSVALIAYIVHLVRGRGGEGFGETLSHIAWPWIIAGLLANLIQVALNVGRWNLLLVGQGIRAPASFLWNSMMIARFFGAVSIQAHLGYVGWRVYDIAKRTDKLARTTAAAVVEVAVGQFAFAGSLMLSSFWGIGLIGIQGVLIVNLICIPVVLAGIALLVRPTWFTLLANFLPGVIRTRVQTMVDALQAYEGKSYLVASAFGLALLTHSFHMLVSVCAAMALGVIEVGPGEVFFGSSLETAASHLPISINGIGVREGAAVAIYGGAGVSVATAALIASVRFGIEMSISILSGPIFWLRSPSYNPTIVVEDADREDKAIAIEAAPESERLKVRHGFALGVAAGLFAGMLIGLGEGAVVMSSGQTGGWVMAYGAVAYAFFCALVGGVGGAVFAAIERSMHRKALSDALIFTLLSSGLVAGIAFGLTAFRVRRDIYEEQLKFASANGAMVLAGCALGALLLFVLLGTATHYFVKRRPGAWMTRPLGSLSLVVAVVSILGVSTVVASAGAESARTIPPAPQGAGNVLFIVVDTLRADHLPAYGYDSGSTPSLDAFADDAIRFDQAFSNASWTRPSFASILTGRYPSSHSVMAKSDALPSELVTMGEAFADAGYRTAGVVTNYNVGPYFNFDQGFDDYRYLEPDFVLWADDSAAKLLLVQFLRQKIESLRDAFFGVRPGTAYRDAETVNSELLSWLDRQNDDHPFMLFVGYMDPHDPYLEHPYNGVGYARAAHQHPELSERDRLVELYDGEITYWDSQFGRLIDDLRSRGLYDDLTIVITADHGEEFAEHGGFWHGTTLYDEQVRVPLFVKLPNGRRAGTTVGHWVQSVDLMPTLLNEAGIAIPDGIQGGQLFEGTDRVFAEESHEGNVLESVRQRRGTDELKLITANPGNPRHLPTSELFRVDLDPGEHDNLVESASESLEIAEAALLAARVDAAEGAVQGEQVEIDADARRRLCQLGYLTGEACGDAPGSASEQGEQAPEPAAN